MNPNTQNRYTDMATEMRELYDAYISVGFTEEQTIKLMESMTYGLFLQIRQENEQRIRRLKRDTELFRARQKSTEDVNDLMKHV